MLWPQGVYVNVNSNHTLLLVEHQQPYSLGLDGAIGCCLYCSGDAGALDRSSICCLRGMAAIASANSLKQTYISFTAFMPGCRVLCKLSTYRLCDDKHHQKLKASSTLVLEPIFYSALAALGAALVWLQSLHNQSPSPRHTRVA